MWPIRECIMKDFNLGYFPPPFTYSVFGSSDKLICFKVAADPVPGYRS